jgi:hypothetical protein
MWMINADLYWAAYDVLVGSNRPPTGVSNPASSTVKRLEGGCLLYRFPRSANSRTTSLAKIAINHDCAVSAPARVAVLAPCADCTDRC